MWHHLFRVLKICFCCSNNTGNLNFRGNLYEAIEFGEIDITCKVAPISANEIVYLAFHGKLSLKGN